MSFKLNLLKLARARIAAALDKQARFGFPTVLSAGNATSVIPALSRGPYQSTPTPPPGATGTTTQPGTTTPATNTPAANPLGGLLGGAGGTGSNPMSMFTNALGLRGGQTPQQIAQNPLMGMFGKHIIGMGGLPALGFIASNFGKDYGGNWNTLTRGNSFGIPKASAFEKVADVPGLPDLPVTAPAPTPAPTPTRASTQYPEHFDPQNIPQPARSRVVEAPPTWGQRAWGDPNQPGLNYGERLVESRGPIMRSQGLAMLGDWGFHRGVYGASRLAAPYHPQVTPRFLQFEHTPAAFSRLGSRLGPLSRVPIASRLGRIGLRTGVGLTGGPTGPLINAGIEGYDILTGGHGYDPEHIRESVTPTNEAFGRQLGPTMSYLTSAYNAVGNPIRSTHLLYNDVSELLGGNPERNRLPYFQEQAAARATDARVNERINRSLAALQARVDRGGLPSLSRGEQTDYFNWQRRGHSAN